MLPKKEKKIRRHKRIRSKIKGINSRPRLSVFHSNSHIYCQIINDEKGETLVAASDLELKTKGEKKTAKTKVAFEVGKLIAERAKGKGIKEVVFDRGGYQYHGKVKTLADGAREGGLKF